MNYSSETINKLYYGNRLINISVTNGGGGGDVPSNLSEWTYDDDGNLKSITYTAETIPTSAYSYSKLTDVTIKDSVRSIERYAFSHCGNLTNVNIPNSVTRINSSVFRNCDNLTSIAIPNSVTSIGASAFNQCRSLSSVTIGNSVTSIGDRAFNICGITSVVIPNNVTIIGNQVFYGCNLLTSVTVLAETPPTLGGSAFYNTNDCPIYVPAASVDAYKAAANWSTYASRIQAIP